MAFVDLVLKGYGRSLQVVTPQFLPRGLNLVRFLGNILQSLRRKQLPGPRKYVPSASTSSPTARSAVLGRDEGDQRVGDTKPGGQTNKHEGKDGTAKPTGSRASPKKGGPKPSPKKGGGPPRDAGKKKTMKDFLTK